MTQGRPNAGLCLGRTCGCRLAAVYARPQLPSLNFGGGHHDINPVYRAVGQVFVNQHAYGIPAAHSPVFCYRESESGELATAHLAAQALT
jgi:hypothetical protein